MRLHLIPAIAALAWAATASAQPTSPPISVAEQATILHAMQLTPDARGRVVNACEDKVSPQYLRADLGGAVGMAVLVIVPGGPNSATCYGDAPGDMQLMKREGASWRAIFTGAGYIAILPTLHGGVHDIALGGPGFSFPVYQWNGRAYDIAPRKISDTEFGRYPSLP